MYIYYITTSIGIWHGLGGNDLLLLLYCCFTAALFLLSCCFIAALLPLYCCFTAALLLLYCRSLNL